MQNDDDSLMRMKFRVKTYTLLLVVTPSTTWCVNLLLEAEGYSRYGFEVSDPRGLYRAKNLLRFLHQRGSIESKPRVLKIKLDKQNLRVAAQGLSSTS